MPVCQSLNEEFHFLRSKTIQRFTLPKHKGLPLNVPLKVKNFSPLSIPLQSQCRSPPKHSNPSTAGGEVSQLLKNLPPNSSQTQQLRKIL
ncbi:hypothetical protein TNCV_336501 [Trichonephila clavipes]|nr:hypothetical protein TNCV_336501 [Trichonephila clavipes]